MPTPIRLAIAGVGNCASSLVQGITYYRDAVPEEVVPGLMHVELGGYHVRDVVPVASFDVDQARDLARAGADIQLLLRRQPIPAELRLDRIIAGGVNRTLGRGEPARRSRG